jgi:hypothetical protein
MKLREGHKEDKGHKGNALSVHKHRRKSQQVKPTVRGEWASNWIRVPDTGHP